MRDMFSSERLALYQFGGFHELSPISDEEWRQDALADASIVVRPGGRGSWAPADPLFAAYVRHEIHAD